MISNELLKKKILDEAIHGKLVENDLSLPPVDVEEIKKDVPFEIPNNWKWTEIKNVVDMTSGGTPSRNVKEYWENGNIPWVKISDMRGKYLNSTDEFITSYGLKNSSAKIFSKGTILYSIFATIGNVSILNIDATTNQAIVGLTPKIEIEINFLYYLLKYIKDFIKQFGKGTSQLNINQQVLKKTLIPLPPLEEQEKIVKKIEKLFELIDKKENNDKEKEKLKTLLKEKILDSAIHGELVENDLSLLIVDVEEIKEVIPFEIPNNWKWSNFEYITTKISDGAHSTPKYVNNGIPFLSVKDISNGNISFENCKYISEEQHKVLYSRCDPKYGDLLITKVGTTGVPVVVDTNIEFSLFVSVAMLRFDENKIYNKYIKYATLSKLIQSQIDENTRGAANKNWVIKDIKKTIIPIPPLEQQKKIVEKIEKCFKLIEQL